MRPKKNEQEMMISKLKILNEITIDLLGFIPKDKELMNYNLLGKNLLDVPYNNVAYNRVKQIIANII